MDRKHALTQLARLALRRPQEAPKLSAALRGRAQDVMGLVVEVGIETGGPIGPMLAQELVDTSDHEAASQLIDSMPEETLALRELAATVAELCVQRARALALDEEDELYDLHLGTLLNDWSNRLFDVGDAPAALRTNAEACEIYRRVLQMSPEEAYSQGFDDVGSLRLRPTLAMFLTNRAQFALAAGDRSAAREATHDAVGMYDRLKAEAASGETPFPPAEALDQVERHAGALAVSADLFRRDGQPQRAVRAAEKALALVRQEATPSTETGRRALAGALLNVAILRSEDPEASPPLAELRQSVDLYRTLADRAPDAYAPDLALALRISVEVFSQYGQQEEATEALEELRSLPHFTRAEAHSDSGDGPGN